MCLPNYIETKIIDESNPMIGHRNWKLLFKSNKLKSTYIEYEWSEIEGPHIIKEKDSGIYAYSNYNYYNYNYYNYYSNNYNYSNNYYYNYYIIGGIIKQWGRVAVHESGQRSEYAKIVTLFTIRESNMRGDDKFQSWVIDFNKTIKVVAEQYKCDTISYQDFLDS